jgi:hypothetical protein
VIETPYRDVCGRPQKLSFRTKIQRAIAVLQVAPSSTNLLSFPGELRLFSRCHHDRGRGQRRDGAYFDGPRRRRAPDRRRSLNFIACKLVAGGRDLPDEPWGAPVSQVGRQVGHTKGRLPSCHNGGRIGRLAGVGVAGRGFARAESFPARLRMAVPTFERVDRSAVFRSLAKKPTIRVRAARMCAHQ